MTTKYDVYIRKINPATKLGEFIIIVTDTVISTGSFTYESGSVSIVFDKHHDLNGFIQGDVEYRIKNIISNFQL